MAWAERAEARKRGGTAPGEVRRAEVRGLPSLDRITKVV
jgi:hypothetical protein